MRQSRWAWVIVFVLVLFALIQVPPGKIETLPVTGDVGAPPAVGAILRRSCYDCHSSETVWPWYGRVAPVSWLIRRDVEEGRDELNFSQWDKLTPERRAKKLRESWEEVEKGEMPPWYYLPLHPAARLSADDRETLRAWFLAPATP